MGRENITENVKRRLYTESMGRCMNPNCQRELLQGSGDIIEKAHIIPYCKTSDNSFENLIVLCPNCHKSFDKSSSFSTEQVKSWKKLRKDELDKLFTKKFATFDDLRKEVAPLLS
ncbi:HNH endonuclease, partial [Listeria monocytogenes]|nr:HNH endonuclease [Listeria monocytogenes]